jgi:hypothetical protein
MKDKIKTLFKEHPVSMTVFAVYLVLWLFVYLHVTFDYCQSTSDSINRANYWLMLSFLFTLPYALVLLLIGVIYDKYREYYLRMGFLIAIPMIISALLGF